MLAAIQSVEEVNTWVVFARNVAGLVAGIGVVVFLAWLRPLFQRLGDAIRSAKKEIFDLKSSDEKLQKALADVEDTANAVGTAVGLVNRELENTKALVDRMDRLLAGQSDAQMRLERDILALQHGREANARDIARITAAVDRLTSNVEKWQDSSHAMTIQIREDLAAIRSSLGTGDAVANAIRGLGEEIAASHHRKTER